MCSGDIQFQSRRQSFIRAKAEVPRTGGMFFLSDQVTEYDRQRASITEVEQLQLFVNDEKTAIQWVRQQLSEKPMNIPRLQPLYMKEAQRVWEKHEQPIELADDS